MFRLAPFFLKKKKRGGEKLQAAMLFSSRLDRWASPAPSWLVDMGTRLWVSPAAVAITNACQHCRAGCSRLPHCNANACMLVNGGCVRWRTYAAGPAVTSWFLYVRSKLDKKTIVRSMYVPTSKLLTRSIHKNYILSFRFCLSRFVSAD